MKKIATTFFLLLFLGNLSLLHAQLPTAFTDRLNTVFDSVCNKYHLKGASAAMLVPNAGTWKRAWGETYDGVPMQTNMLLGIGSNTKTIISATLLKMQEMQLLDLDDSIGKWIVNVPNVNGQITIRQLLNHTSGIKSYTAYSYFYDSANADPFRIWEMEDILTFIGTPDFAVGTGWNYSNSNYLIAGIIIERVMNQPVQQVMRDLILTPQGLSETIYYPQESSGLDIAHNWSMGINGVSLVDVMDYPGYSMNALFSLSSAAGGVMQTAEDNVKFWNKLTSGQIISTASFQEMRQYYAVTPSFGYGLGIMRLKNALNGRSYFTHGGTHTGYIAENLVDTISSICISVLTNQDSISNNMIRLNVIGPLHKVTLQMPVTAVENAKLPVHVNVYPNPACDRLYFDRETANNDLRLTLLDMTGRTVLQTSIPENNSVDISLLQPALYLLHLQDETGNTYTQKLQVVK